MKYQGKYRIFDPRIIGTYPFEQRKNKVTAEHLIAPKSAIEEASALAFSGIEQLSSAVVKARKADKPVILFTGAHLIKNGLSRIVIDLIDRGLVTLIAGNGATCIHDFELALMGATSEDVPNALGKGLFGMSAEFAYINAALSLGNMSHLGFGESLGRMIVDSTFRDDVYRQLDDRIKLREFKHPELSILAACYRKGIPFTAHVGIGTDVVDQHESFDGEAKGGCSGRDFLIYVSETTRLAEGGVVLNIGSAGTGPEVLLKAVSMSANAGSVPKGIVTADFDIRALRPDHVGDESKEGYYFRDQKSVVSRIPEAFGGKGFYIQGDQKQTVPAFYRSIVSKL